VLAYTMVAERDNQKVTKERTSALILLANARVWASEGWQVVITDADGKQLDSAGFEQWLAPVEASPLQPVNAASLEAQDQLEAHDLSAQDQNVSAEAEHPAEQSEEAYEADESEEAYERLDPFEESPHDDHDFSEASSSLT
jgi:hypothetical protein